MEYVILYFSGTGNTALIAEEIKKRLENSGHAAETISIEEQEKLKKFDFTGKILGFGFPVYKFTYPDIFERVFPIINKPEVAGGYFMFSTYARFDACAFNDFSENLDKSRFHRIARQSFKAPSCGISARKPVNDYEYESVMFFEDDIKEKLDIFVQEIVLNRDMGKSIKQKRGFLSKMKKRIVRDIELTKYPKLGIKPDRCTVCGLCVNNCPESNLVKEDGEIRVVDTSGCLHCLRCINHCPSNAITFGELTEGDNRYTFKIRDMLFEKASNGYREEYWRDFDAIVKRWRRKTVKYWLANRNRK